MLVVLGPMPPTEFTSSCKVGLVGNGNCPQTYFGAFLPIVTFVPLCVKVPPIPYSVKKDTLYPELYSVTTEISEYDDSTGMTWPVCATLGSSGGLRYSLCVKVSLHQSGIVTVIGFVSTDTPVAGASMTRKWCVVPESNIQQSFMALRLELITPNMIFAACAYPYLLELICWTLFALHLNSNGILVMVSWIGLFS